MKCNTRPALALLLGASLALSLTACDYRYTPGLDNQRRDFANPPGWRNQDVYRDSINYKQRAPAPGGIGSAAAMENGTVDEQRASVPRAQSGRLPKSRPSDKTASPAAENRPTESGE